MSDHLLGSSHQWLLGSCYTQYWSEVVRQWFGNAACLSWVIFKNFLHFCKVEGQIVIFGLDDRDLELLDGNPLLPITKGQKEFNFEFSGRYHTLTYSQNRGYVICERFRSKIFWFYITSNLDDAHYFLAKNKRQIPRGVRDLDDWQICHFVHFLRDRNHCWDAWCEMESDCVSCDGVNAVLLVVLDFASMLDVTNELFCHF